MALKRSGPLRRTGFKPREPKVREKVERAPAVLSRSTVRAVMTPVASAVRAAPKNPSDENPRLLELARGQTCLLRWRRGCLGDDGTTTVACHENRIASGNKGLGYKAHDWRSAWGCFVCHSALDQPRDGTPHDVLTAVFDAAWLRQLVEWQRIADNPQARPWKRAASAWALERARAFLQRGNDGGCVLRG